MFFPALSHFPATLTNILFITLETGDAVDCSSGMTVAVGLDGEVVPCVGAGDLPPHLDIGTDRAIRLISNTI